MTYNPLLIVMFLSSFIASRSFFTAIPSVHVKPGNLIMRASKKTKQTNAFHLPNSPNVYEPRGTNQIHYVDYLNNQNVSLILGVGPAGTGKTFFACATAVKELQRGNIDKIILTRPVVTVEEDIGYLPGSLINKMNPWTRPIFDILEEYYSLREIDSMIHSGIIEISPLAFMRGRTFKKSFIIADEMQNSSPNQMLMLVTRIGEGSRMVITGDLKQSDRCDDNGLFDLLHKIKSHKRILPEIKTVHFDRCDVERSHIVSRVLQLYSDNEERNIVDNDSIKHSKYSVFYKNYTRKSD
jgi:phosphate starvation-inducible PhoH-like protein